MKEESLIKSNKGFTLVEIVVTLVLFSLIATITTLSLFSWQKYSTSMSMDENAELIYMAARNKIAMLRSNNVLMEQADWGSKAKPKLYKVNESKDIYYAVCSQDDYDNFTSKDKTVSDSVDGSAKLLFKLVSDYLHDKNMLKANIAIEYTEDGDICAVYYSDRTRIGYGSGDIDFSVESNKTGDKLSEAVIGSYIPK